MPALHVVTCVDRNFEKYAENLKKICKNLQSVRLWVYDIGLQKETLGVADYKVFATENYAARDSNKQIVTNHKPIIIKHFLEKHQAPCLYIDADCIFTGELCPAFGEGVDIGVTPRALREQKAQILQNGLINAGVLYFNYSDDVLNFIQKWAESCADGMVSDQRALSHILSEKIDLVDGGQDQFYDDMKIRLLDPDVYNDVTCKTGKIFHCKSVARRKSKYRAYCVLSTMMKLCPNFCDALISFNRKHRLLVYRRKKNEVYQKRLEG